MISDAVKIIDFKVEEVYKTSDGYDFILKKKNGIPKYLSKHGIKYYNHPCYMFHSFADSGPRLSNNKKINSNIDRMEIFMNHTESVILKVILINKNGKKTIDYISDDFIKIGVKFV